MSALRRLTPLVLLLAACGGSGESLFPIEPPEAFVRSILRSEAVVEELHARVGAVLEGSAPGRMELAAPARFPDPREGRRLPDARLEFRLTEGPGEVVLTPAKLSALLSELTADWTELARRSFELDRFFLAEDGRRATGRAELRLAGPRRGGGRADLRATCEVEFRADEAGAWRLAALDLVEAIWIAGEVPLFRDVTAATGFTFGMSETNRAMLQSFIDEHRVLALTGLSAFDWNRDGLPDLVASMGGALAVLFENDGAGGFVPRELPVEAPNDAGIFALVVDLDGDGVEEIVGSRVLRYAGDQASCGLYRRDGETWSLDEAAFTFENPVGLRGVAVQTIVPFDLEGDGDLDLFFGVYGTHESRGESYNLVEAHDGGANHLFLNEGGLRFREVTAERGLSGVQYTYVALPHDFDGDGDTDLFEGNDFGPNRLWWNDGEGRFTSSGDAVFEGESAYTMGVTLADHDDDGRLSMYVVNMSSEAGERIGRIAGDIGERTRERVLTIAAGNFLYAEGGGEGSGPVWEAVPDAAGAAEGEWGWGAMFCDLDGDGDEELLALDGFTSHADPGLGDWDSLFWRQVATDAALLERGAMSFDVNADQPFEGSYAGYQRDRLWVEPDGARGRFFDAAYLYGLDRIEDGRCVVPLDVDGDGDLDLAAYSLQGLRLLENTAGVGRFCDLKLVATRSHPAALGARVEVTAGGRTQHDLVQLVEGFQSQVPLELRLAWPAGTERLDEVVVRWPSGGIQRWSDLPLDRRLVLTEGEAEVGVRELPRWSADPASLEELAPAVDAGAVTVTRVDAPDGPWPLREALAPAFPAVRFASHPTGPAGAVFVHDAAGRLRRAFAGAPPAADLAAFLELLADEPPFPELSMLRGRRLLAQGRVDEARSHFEQALAGDPGLPGAAEGLARVERLQGNLAASEAACRRSVEIDPDYAVGHFNLGVLALGTGRPEEALGHFEEVLRIRGEDGPTLLAMGEAALVARDAERALAIFARASAADPMDPEPEVLRGKLFGQERRLEEARAAFAEALRRAPGHAEAAAGLERVEALLGR
jgi:tetratricopeptide (TPR) repeat protein